MASAASIPVELICFKPVGKNIDEYVMILEMRVKKEVYTHVELPLDLWPEGWRLGGKYSFDEFIKMLL